MRKRVKSPPRLNWFKILKIFIFVTLIGFVFLWLSKLIKVNAIECVTQYGNCSPEILTELNKISTDEYFSKKSQTKKLLEQSILINEYQLQYQIPAKLKVSLNVKSPRHALLDKSRNKYLLVDKTGLVLLEVGESKLPTVIVDSTQSLLSKKVTAEELFSLKLIERVSILYSVDSGQLNLNSQDFLVNLKEGILVRFPITGDADLLAGSLSAIFSRLNENTKDIKIDNITEIDLRFKNVVLR